jgi:hypothetical protein
LCDYLETYATDSDISEDQKLEIGQMLMEAYETLKDRRDFETKKSRLSELIAAFSIKWEDPTLKCNSKEI